MNGQLTLPKTKLAIFAAPRRELIPGRLTFSKAEKASETFELMIYGDIGDSWWGESVTAANVATQIRDSKAKKILVRINSYGGSVTDGTAIYNALRSCGAEITCRIDGIAASIASLIAMAGDVVEIGENALLMIHAPWTGVAGNSKELREAADLLDTFARAMATSYSRKTGRTVDEELVWLMDGVDHWLTGADAKARGYVDDLLEAEAAADETAAALRDEIVMAAMSRYRSAPAAAAASYSRRLPSLLSQPAAAAAIPAPPRASRTLESRMNWKTLAKALNIKVTDEMTDSAIRDLIAQHLKLSASCSDDDIVAAWQHLVRANHASQPPPAPGTGGAPAGGEPTPAARATAMFTAAMRGQENNLTLRALQTRTEVALAAGTAVDIPSLQQQIMDAVQVPASPVAGRHVPVSGGEDQRDKTRAAAVNWLLVRASAYKHGSKEHKAVSADLGANPFHGMSLADIARACLEEAGVNVRGMNRHNIISNAITQSTSDFPILFENALHKTLLAGFTVVPSTYDRICKIGTLTDFRPHLRYRSSSIGDLAVRQENGEFKTLNLNDGERELLVAEARGGIVRVTREMLVNDDMSVFSGIALELGKAAIRTREKALYALLAMNGGMGPVMGSGEYLFAAAHRNISANPGAPTVTLVDKDRQQMASQLDPSGNDFVDIRPSIWLGPLALGGAVRVINGDKYDPDATNKYQRTNISYGTYSEVIDTPRLSGAPWYSFADPNVEPVIEIGFLDGEQTPQLATEEAFTQHGMAWRVVDEWGMGAVGTRGAIRNAGA